jgi:hypothetical protein
MVANEGLIVGEIVGSHIGRRAACGRSTDHTNKSVQNHSQVVLELFGG